MGIKVRRKEQPIDSITLYRKGYSAVVVTETDSGKLLVKPDKDGVQGLVFSKNSAAELVEAFAHFGVDTDVAA